MSQTLLATTNSPDTGRETINANFTELYSRELDTTFTQGLAEDDILQYNNGLWTNRTMAELKSNMLQSATAITCAGYNFNMGTNNIPDRFFMPYIGTTAYITFDGGAFYTVSTSGTLFAFGFSVASNTFNNSVSTQVYIDGVVSDLTVTLTAGQTFVSNVINEVQVLAGQRICFHVTPVSGTGTIGTPVWTVFFR